MKLTKKNIFTGLIILLLAIGVWFGSLFWSFLKTPLIVTGQPAVKLLFAQGNSVKKIAHTLKQQNLIQHPLFFVLLVRFTGAEYHLKAGEYLIEPEITPGKLIQKMIKGDAIRHAFTVVEGWNFSQLLAALNDNQHVKHLTNALTVDEIMTRIGHPGELPEGRFAPDTYLFSGETTDLEILVNSYRLMQKRLQTFWDNRDKEWSYHCPYEALIVASLIEKETAQSAEKPLIAGVILRRLNQGMLLQVCPTVIYGLGKRFSGKLKRTDFSIDTPYNTYIHRGLPPTPISMPGKDSIEAAMHPATVKFWYYAAKGDGTHEFSVSFEDQQKAIKKYLHKK